MVSFDLSGKVALVTGGASGLGYIYACELLAKGVRGVTLADINAKVGKKSIEEIESKFGKNKAIFVKTDVTNYEQFEDAFKKTISTFKNIDILINNAGILNDSIWQKEIEINVNGTIHGILLGLDNYIPKYKSGSEGLILNVASVAGISPTTLIPVYSATKFAVLGLTLSWGVPAHYDRTHVRVVGVCPGVTLTPLIANIASGNNLGPEYDQFLDTLNDYPTQKPEEIAPHVIRIIEKAPPGTIWVAEGGEEPYQFILPDRFGDVSKIRLP